MKIKRITILFLVVVLATTSCSDEDFDLEQPDVKQFVSMIKKGSYTEEVGYDLPSFSIDHLDDLMVYLNDTSEVKYYPANPITSKRTEPKILNECIMWTIEGIRKEERYASLEPCLIDLTNYSEYKGYARLTGKQLLDIGERYKQWYQSYQQSLSEVVRKQDVFDRNRYRWN